MTGNTEHNLKTYYIVNVSTLFIQGTNVCGHRVFGGDGIIRVDSLSGKIYGWQFCQTDSTEYMIDSLNSKPNDSVNTCYYPGTRVICSDTTSQNIFQFTKQSVSFTITGVEAGAGWRYIKDFGLSNSGYGNPFYNCVSVLKGCVLNNVLYGDTSTVIGINPISSETPESFSLSQNYPNPFNPTTTIVFSIPLLRGVSEGRGVLSSITIYNSVGQKITELFNPHLSPGTYQADWDASNYSSGLYFYKLTSGEFTETKRMILLR